MPEERVSHRDCAHHVGGLLGQLFNGSFPLVPLPRHNVRLCGRCDRSGSSYGRDAATFQLASHVHGRKYYTQKGTWPIASFSATCAPTMHVSRTMPTMRSGNVGQFA